jgi:hypothetical protein
VKTLKKERRSTGNNFYSTFSAASSSELRALKARGSDAVESLSVRVKPIWWIGKVYFTLSNGVVPLVKRLPH